jgi:hypothetical protein
MTLSGKLIVGFFASTAIAVYSPMIYQKFMGGPCLVVSESVIRFQASAEQKEFLKNITIRNLGHAVGKIESIAVSCGCLEVQLPESLIPPGGEIVLGLKLLLDPQSRKTGKVVDVSLVTNDSRPPAVRVLRVIIDPQAKNSWMPERIDLGLIADMSLPHTKVIGTIEGDAFRFELLGSPPFLDAKLTSVEGPSSSQLRLVIAKRESVGEIYDLIKVRDSIGRTEASLLVGAVKGTYAAAPGSIVIGPISNGYPTVESLVTILNELENADTVGINISQIEISESLQELVTVERIEKAEGRFLVKATFSSKGNYQVFDNLVSGAIAFHITEGQSGCTLRVPVVVILSR